MFSRKACANVFGTRCSLRQPVVVVKSRNKNKPAFRMQEKCQSVRLSSMVLSFVSFVLVGRNEAQNLLRMDLFPLESSMPHFGFSSNLFQEPGRCTEEKQKNGCG